MITIDTITDLLDTHGISATVRVYPEAEFDPAMNKTTKGDYDDYNVIVVPPYRYTESFKKTTLVTSGVAYTGFANDNLQFDVRSGLILIINDVEWVVIDVVPIRNKSGLLYYQLRIEKGN
jgi:hypothetical protein